MKAKIILAAMLAAATVGAHAQEHDPYKNRASGEWLETVNDQTAYDPATIYRGKGWVAVWAKINTSPLHSHGYVHNQEVSRVAIVCKSHAYTVASASLYWNGNFLVRHDFTADEIAQSFNNYDENSPVGAIALELCGTTNSKW